jgi:SAM-dependent methyltransferase
MQQAGWEVLGIEPDGAAAAALRQLGIPCVQATGEDVDLAGLEQRYDAVTLSHVLEHCHDPDRVLDACWGMLKPRGLLWLQVPNVASLGARAFGNSWWGLDPPRHLVLPSARGLERALRKAGFDDLRRSSSGMGAALGYPASMEIRANRTPLLPFWQLWRRHPLAALAGCVVDAICVSGLARDRHEFLTVTARRSAGNHA